MTGIIDAIFSPQSNTAPPQVAGPTASETQAQKTQDDITQAQETKVARDAEARAKVVTARTAGPQTLFKRAGEIPKAVSLGGGART